jgi:hypothetical protein
MVKHAQQSAALMNRCFGITSTVFQTTHSISGKSAPKKNDNPCAVILLIFGISAELNIMISPIVRAVAPNQMQKIETLTEGGGLWREKSDR